MEGVDRKGTLSTLAGLGGEGPYWQFNADMGLD
jgi:hypothetical protein